MPGNQDKFNYKQNIKRKVWTFYSFKNSKCIPNFPSFLGYCYWSIWYWKTFTVPDSWSVLSTCQVPSKPLSIIFNNHYPVCVCLLAELSRVHSCIKQVQSTLLSKIVFNKQLENGYNLEVVGIIKMLSDEE